MTLRVNAYVLLADPAWLEASVLSYYDLVDRIVASYDSEGIGWNGKPIDVEECVARLRRIDHANKVTFLPGRHHGIPYEHLLELDTMQRQHALNTAAVDADWVVQLDTDEVVLDQGTLRAAIERAAASEATGLHYPSRWLFARLGTSTYLERATRRGRTWPAIAGPIAVKTGATLKLARIHDGINFTVSWRRRHAADMYISKRQSIAHLSTIRSQEQMRAKAQTSSHADDFNWNPYLDAWERAHRNPVRSVIASYRSSDRQQYRLAYIRGARTQDQPWAC